MSNRLDRYKAALILAEAAFSSDKIAAEVFECHPRTISNYRKLLETDKDLQKEYRLALYNKTKEWTKEIPGALKTGIKFIQRSLEDLCPSDPKAVDSVINAMQVLSEIEIMNEAVRAKLIKGRKE
jgi:hypothetical protein